MLFTTCLLNTYLAWLWLLLLCWFAHTYFNSIQFNSVWIKAIIVLTKLRWWCDPFKSLWNWSHIMFHVNFHSILCHICKMARTKPSYIPCVYCTHESAMFDSHLCVRARLRWSMNVKSLRWRKFPGSLHIRYAQKKAATKRDTGNQKEGEREELPWW